ncbi:UDP-3-O-acyl-N-acetylglucosamine deacetylase [Trichinella pseudospiralis]
MIGNFIDVAHMVNLFQVNNAVVQESDKIVAKKQNPTPTWHFELLARLPGTALHMPCVPFPNYRPSHPRAGHFSGEKMANDPQVLNTSLLRAPN